MFSSRRWWWWCSPWTITLVSGSVLYLLLMAMMMLSLDGPKITSTTNLATMANGHAESRTIISRGKYSIISAADDKRSVHKEGLFLKKFYLLFLPPGTVLRPGFPFGGIGPNFPIIPYYGGYGGYGGGGYGGYGYNAPGSSLAAPGGRRRRPGGGRVKGKQGNRFNLFRPL